MRLLILGLLLGHFRRWLDARPQRDWSEIGWAHRVGRLLLIGGALAAFFVPGWLLLAQ
ncbi:MAG TPA: hypothetical protein VNR11_14565 [Xanthobacteraceae bacterium]|nr:hypothetical protein [Xanthobacteraceae bacterium]